MFLPNRQHELQHKIQHKKHNPIIIIESMVRYIVKKKSAGMQL